MKICKRFPRWVKLYAGLFCTGCRTISITTMENQALEIFSATVNAVLPHRLTRQALTFSGDHLKVGGREYRLSHNVTVVGFGKAVIGMVRPVEDVIGDHVVRGMVSVPVGIRSTLDKLGKHDMLPTKTSKIEVIEGAANNLPDECAYGAAVKIYDLAKSLRSSSDLLLVLVSGGGSALLPLPVPPITLQEKLLVTKALAASGASIQELNVVRSKLSLVKGGGLARAAHPAQVLTLILSDIINDPIHLIASGPTVIERDRSGNCVEILQKYNVKHKLPRSVISMLETTEKNSEPSSNIDVKNIVIGSNNLALLAGKAAAEKCGYEAFIISQELTGEARDIGRTFARIACHLMRLYENREQSCDCSAVLRERLLLELDKDKQKSIFMACKMQKPVCLLAGGESTVTVRGFGKGGRNQEMALACGMELEKLFGESPAIGYRVTFLSCGTDGQDGPTDAAGAFVTSDTIASARQSGLNPERFLENNDSYSFWERCDGGMRLVKTGLTGTNVMDVHLLLIEPNQTY